MDRDNWQQEHYLAWAEQQHLNLLKEELNCR